VRHIECRTFSAHMEHLAFPGLTAGPIFCLFEASETLCRREPSGIGHFGGRLTMDVLQTRLKESTA
jgi:hypothetical protein